MYIVECSLIKSIISLTSIGLLTHFNYSHNRKNINLGYLVYCIAVLFEIITIFLGSLYEKLHNNIKIFENNLIL